MGCSGGKEEEAPPPQTKSVCLLIISIYFCQQHIQLIPILKHLNYVVQVIVLNSTNLLILQGYSGPKTLSPAEQEAKKKREEDEKRWIDEAKKVGPRAPFPSKPQYKPGGTEEEYKQFMTDKYSYEAWENDIIRLARKLQTDATAKPN